MKVYNYDGDTKEYLNEGSADADPMEPDNWLIPANSTPVAPPKEVNKQARIFDGEKWSYTIDFRGTEVSANDGSGRKSTITQLGVKPEDVRFEKVPDSEQVAQIKTTMRTQLAMVIDYIMNPTPEKAQALVTEYESLTSDAT